VIERPLGELLEVLIDHRGKTPKKLGGDFTTVGIPVASAINVKSGRVVFDSAPRCVDLEMFDRWMPVRLKADDVLLTSEAPLGEVARVPSDEPLVLGQRLFGLRGRADVLDNTYLFYVLQWKPIRDRLYARSTGTTVHGIRQAELVRVPVPVPPLAEQRAIAEVLGAVDDKIDANRRIAKLLESLAHSWFVEFYEAGGEGWHEGVLNDCIEFMLGGDWGTASPSEEGLDPSFCIRGADIPDIQVGGIGRMPIRYLRQSSLSKRQLQDGDLVVEISGGSPTQSTGRSVLVTNELLSELEASLVCSNFCRILRPKTPTISRFLYLWLRDLYAQNEFLPYENGSYLFRS
jgi:type I restriction enzyme S subunit